MEFLAEVLVLLMQFLYFLLLLDGKISEAWKEKGLAPSD
jgi:hypothetical protein